MKRIFLEDIGILPDYQKNAGKGVAKYNEIRFYVNTTDVCIYVKSRNGMVVRVEPTTAVDGFKLGYFYICDEVIGSIQDIESLVRQARQTHDSDRRGLQRILIDDCFLKNDRLNRSSVSYAAKISMADIKANGGSLYAVEQDIVVIAGSDAHTPADQYSANKAIHPYSVYGDISAVTRGDKESLGLNDSLWFTITIVDNSDTFGSKWTIINGIPALVKAKRCSRRTDGIYINTREQRLDTSIETECSYYKFSDADTISYFKFYDSQSDAKIAIRESNGLEAELKAAEAENRYKKTLQDKENLEREQAVRDRKHKQEMERLQREHEISMEKAEMESKAIVRKNTGDLFKYVPMLISAVLCMLNLMSKKQ